MSEALTALLPVKGFHRSFLERAVGSVRGQSCPEWRLIVVAEPEEATKLAAILEGALADDRVRLVVNEGNRLAGALNTGMRQATTQFSAIILGDDMWAPDAVAVLTAAIDRHRDVDFFHSGRAYIGPDDRRISNVYAPVESFALDDFVSSSPVRHLLCWRREAALAIGGIDETLESVGPDDYDFPWSMAEAGARFMAVPECLYLYRDHREAFRLTTHLPRSVHTRALRTMFRKHGVGRLRIERRIAAAKRGYLRQCLYRSRLDRWLKMRLRYDAQRGWRESYR